MSRAGAKNYPGLEVSIVVAGIIIVASIFASFHYEAATTTVASNVSKTVTSTITVTNTTDRTVTDVVGTQACSIPASYSGDWLTFKYDSQRTGYSPFNFSSTPAGRFQGQLAWQNKSGFSEMVATQSELFVASYWLFALNMSDGRGIWTQTTGAGPAPQSPPTARLSIWERIRVVCMPSTPRQERIVQSATS